MAGKYMANYKEINGELVELDDSGTLVEPQLDEVVGLEPASNMEQPDASGVAEEDKGWMEQAGDFLTGDASGLETALDTARGATLGPLKAAKEIYDVVNVDLGITEAVEEFTGLPLSGVAFDNLDEDDEYFSFLTADEAKRRMLTNDIEIDEMNAVTPLGKFAQETTQFLTGYMAGGPVGKALFGTLKGVKAIGMMAARGGVSDAFSFKADKETISAYIQETPFANEVNSWLVADENDSNAYKRMLRGIEGAGLGIVLDTALIGLLKATKAGIRATDATSDWFFSETLKKSMEKVKDVLGTDSVAKNASLIDDPSVYSFGVVADSNAQALSIQRFKEAVKDPVVDLDSLKERLLYSESTGDLAVNAKDTPVFNWSRMSKEEDGESLSTAWEALTAEIDVVVKNQNQGRYSPGGVKSHSKETLEAARIMERNAGAESGSMIRDMEIRGMDAAELAAQIQAGAHMQLDLQRHIIKLAKLSEQGDVMAQKQLGAQVKMATSLSLSLKDMVRGAARATASGRIAKKAASSTLDLSQIKNVDGSEIGDMGALARRIIALEDGGDLSGMMALVKGESRVNRMVRGMNEFYVNSLLSNPSTQLVNVVGSSIKTAMLPLEKMVGGALSGNGTMVSEGGRQFRYLLTSMRESFQFGYKAMKTYDNVLDPGKGTNEYLSKNAISMEYADWQKAGGARNMQYATAATINGFGHMVRMPSRMLLGMDEVLKQANYRASLRTNLDTEAAAEFAALNVSATERKRLTEEYVERKFLEGFDKDGKATDEMALADARSGTFTTPLDPERGLGTASISMVSDVVNKAPILRQFAPFIRTPWNILADVAQRSPGLNMLNSKFRKEIMSDDPRISSAARGKMAVGAALWGGAVMLAAEGKITGSGPKDFRVLEMWMKQGWRPYSFVHEDSEGNITYTPFNRADPIATFLGMAADWNQIASNQSIEDNEDIFMSLLLGLRDQLASKTFIKSTMNVVQGLTGTEAQSARAVGAHISGYAPGILNTVYRVGQDIIGDDADDRESNIKRLTRGGDVLDRMKAKVPGWGDLPAQYDVITGEPLLVDQTPGGYLHSSNFMPQSMLRKDAVSKELIEQGIPYQEVDRSDGGYDFDTNEMNTLHKLIFKPKPNGKTLNAALAHEMTKKSYQRAHSGEDLTGMIDGTRKDRLQAIIQEYHRDGKEALEKVSPRYAEYVSSMETIDKGLNSSMESTKSGAQSSFKDLMNRLR